MPEHAGDETFVTISHQEVWQELRQHEKANGDGGHADHEQRIRRLEWRYYAILAGLLTGVVGAVMLALKT